MSNCISSLWRILAFTPSLFGPTLQMRAAGARTAAGGLSLLALLTLGAGNLSAQQTAVCSDTPGEGERIECTQPSTSSTDISLFPQGVDLDTTDFQGSGVGGLHEGTGKITIDVSYRIVFEEEGEYTVVFSDISTTGEEGSGVTGRHTGAGDIDIDVATTNITTTGNQSHGIEAFIGHTDIETDDPPLAAGNIDIDVSALVTIETEGSFSHGVYQPVVKGRKGIDTIDLAYYTPTWP